MNKQQLLDHYEAQDESAVQEVAALSAEEMKQMEAFDLLGKVIVIYTIIRPFIEWARKTLPFLGPKLRNGLKTFVDFLDKVTGYVEEGS